MVRTLFVEGKATIVPEVPHRTARRQADHGAVAVAPDGQRMLIVEYPYAAGQTIHVLTNWHERIK